MERIELCRSPPGKAEGWWSSFPLLPNYIAACFQLLLAYSGRTQTLSYFVDSCEVSPPPTFGDKYFMPDGIQKRSGRLSIYEPASLVIGTH